MNERKVREFSVLRHKGSFFEGMKRGMCPGKASAPHVVRFVKRRDSQKESREERKMKKEKINPSCDRTDHASFSCPFYCQESGRRRWDRRHQKIRAGWVCE